MRRVALILLAACSSSPENVATGELGEWLAGPALPTPRANHCAAVIGDWLLVIGGNHATGDTFAATDEIHAAELQADGSLGPWQLAGKLPSPASECTAASEDHTLYVIDGLYDDPSDDGQVWSATLDDTGHLSALSSIGALPQGVVAISSEAIVHDGSLLVMHTELPMNGDDTSTLRTRLGGALAWSADTWQGVGFRAQAEYAFTGKFAYTLGGYHDPSEGAMAGVFVASLGSTIGPATSTTTLPAPVAFGEAVAVDDWLFVAGGRAQVFGGAASTAVYAAPIAADGSLGAWQMPTALPMARTNHVLSLVGDYLVLTGGATSGGGDSTVLLARVRTPAAGH
jgi:hypothetical protein